MIITAFVRLAGTDYMRASYSVRRQGSCVSESGSLRSRFRVPQSFRDSIIASSSCVWGWKKKYTWGFLKMCCKVFVVYWNELLVLVWCFVCVVIVVVDKVKLIILYRICLLIWEDNKRGFLRHRILIGCLDDEILKDYKTTHFMFWEMEILKILKTSRVDLVG